MKIFKKNFTINLLQMIDRKTTRAPAVDTGISVTSTSIVQLKIVLAFYTRMLQVMCVNSALCLYQFVLLGASRIAFIQFAMSQIT